MLPSQLLPSVPGHNARITTVAGSFAIAIACALASPALAQSGPNTSFGRVRGTAFDSLSMEPLRGASVWIEGTARATITDDRGRFVLDSVPTGSQLLAYSSPALDSIGFGSQGRRVTVAPDSESSVTIAVPSLATFWRSLCRNQQALGSDSGIVWGRVLDAETARPYVGAYTTFMWYDMRKVDRKADFAQLSTRVMTDSTGSYYACGLPTEIILASQAYTGDSTRTTAASGEVEYAIGARGVHAVNLMASADMTRLGSIAAMGALGTTASANTSPDAGKNPLTRRSGTATLRGNVRDNAGRALPDVLVSVTSADTAVRTGKDGSFTLTAMPGGTHSLQLRSVGYAMLNTTVDIKPGGSSTVNLVMPQATELATYNVRAERSVPIEKTEYEIRRKQGLGYSRDFAGRGDADPFSILQTIPRLQVVYGPGTVTVTQQSAGRLSSCTPTMRLDGKLVDAEIMRVYPIENLRSVEVFGKFEVVAPYITSGVNSCGLILYWSKTSW
ncbi:MAG: carboxypeptidase-like regulatory domain-containing protein [Gemmatimonas sp.]